MRGLPYRCLLALERRAHQDASAADRVGRGPTRIAGTTRSSRWREIPQTPGTWIAIGKIGLPRVNAARTCRWLCFAKKAAAFFRISRSSRSMAILFPQPRELLALGGRQARCVPWCDRRGRASTHSRKRGFGQIEIAGRRADASCLRRGPAGRRLALKSSVELPARRGFGVLCHRCGHRIPLSERMSTKRIEERREKDNKEHTSSRGTDNTDNTVFLSHG